MRKSARKNEKGYTLLEYCAGAAIITGVLWGSLSGLGGDLSDLLGAVSNWATNRTNGISDD
ncbi:MAG: Flp family type IVb pilin [Pseudomonadota bacterium]|jgi:hypothetical protein